MIYLQRSKPYVALLFLLFFGCIAAMAQTKTVSGLIRSAADNNPAIGVSVQVKGTGLGTSTDENGRFTLSNVPSNATLVLSGVGFVLTEVRVGDRTTVDVTLKADQSALSEVVVTGYRTQTRGTITGSVAAVTGAQLENAPYDNLSNALAGRLSGVTITQAAGTPGMESSIKVRAQATSTIRIRCMSSMAW